MMIFRKTVLYILIFTYITTAGLTLFGIPYYIFPLIIILIDLILQLSKINYKLIITHCERKFYILVFMVLIYIVCVNLCNLNISGLISIFVKLIFFIILLVYLNLISINVDLSRQLINVLILSVSLSALVAIGQILKIEFFYDIYRVKYIFNIENNARYYNFLMGIYNGRAVGLGPYPLIIAFQLVQIFPLSIMNYNYYVGYKKIVFVVLSLIIFIATILCASRAAFLIVVFCCFILLIKLSKVLNKKIILMTLFILIILVIILYIVILTNYKVNISLLLFKRFGDSSEQASRINTYKYVLNKVFSTPYKFIIGNGANTVLNNEANDILNSSHNFILGTLLEYGLIGLMLLIAFYRTIISKIRKSNNSKDKIYLFLTIASYLTMSSVQDQSILRGDVFHYIVIIIIYNYLNNSGKLMSTNLKRVKVKK